MEPAPQNGKGATVVWLHRAAVFLAEPCALDWLVALRVSPIRGSLKPWHCPTPVGQFLAGALPLQS